VHTRHTVHVRERNALQGQVCSGLPPPRATGGQHYETAASQPGQLGGGRQPLHSAWAALCASPTFPRTAPCESPEVHTVCCEKGSPSHHGRRHVEVERMVISAHTVLIQGKPSRTSLCVLHANGNQTALSTVRTGCDLHKIPDSSTEAERKFICSRPMSYKGSSGFQLGRK